MKDVLCVVHQCGGGPHWLLHRARCHVGHGWVWGCRGHLQLREDSLLSTHKHDPDWGQVDSTARRPFRTPTKSHFFTHVQAAWLLTTQERSRSRAENFPQLFKHLFSSSVVQTCRGGGWGDVGAITHPPGPYVKVIAVALEEWLSCCLPVCCIGTLI